MEQKSIFSFIFRNPGLITHILSSIYELIDIHKDDVSYNNISLNVSFIEIYNDRIYDLLVPPPSETWINRPYLKLYTSRDGQPMLQNLKEIDINNTEDGLNVLNEGLKSRTAAQTQLNIDSSRSHSIFTIKIYQNINGEKKLKSKFQICDLAGSERINRANSVGIRQKEAGQINSSLMHLMRCFDTLRHNQKHTVKKIVPFRDSKLTRLFQEFFVGENVGSISMIVNISTNPADYDETLYTLKYACLSSEIQAIPTKYLLIILIELIHI